MDNLFGISIGTILAVCLASFAGMLVLVGYLALSNRIFFKLGVRKPARRPSRTVLIVVGLMLGTTIITAAFTTGDTMTYTIRTAALRALGSTDEIVSIKGLGKLANGRQSPQGQTIYFDQSLFSQVREAAMATGLVDGVMPVIDEGVAVQDVTSQQNEPALVIFGSDASYATGFSQMRDQQDNAVSVQSLGANEVFLNSKAGDKLKAHPGDDITLLVAGKAAKVKVRGIVDYEGTGTADSSVIARLDFVQALFGKTGQINHIFVSNRGDALSGADHSQAVIDALAPTLAKIGLEADGTKQDTLKSAEEAGNVFTTAFITFGSFSVVAGVMLIFLIFVMVAAERKPEMGIARAIGTQRGHLVQMFIFEGLAYDLLAAFVGAALGVLVAFGMVIVMAQAFGGLGIEIRHHVELRSLMVSYTLGVLLTFIVVTFSAWRVSVLNIVSAIRNLPEDDGRQDGRRRVPWSAVAMLALGVPLTVLGLTSLQGSLFWVGVSLVIASFVPFLRWLGLNDRIAYTLPGLALSIVWLLPFRALSFILPEFHHDMSIFVVGGSMAVLGATWVVMYNSSLILDGLMLVFGRFRLMAPVVKTAVSRPLANRFRSGMAVAMFSLVVLTLVVMAIVTGSMTDVFNDVQTFGGGFDLQATTLRTSPGGDLKQAIAANPDLKASDFEAVSDMSVASLSVHQAGSAAEFKDYMVRGVDNEFLRRAKYTFALKAPNYATDRDVWDAIAANPDLAVIDANAEPHRTNFNFAVGLPDFQMEGSYYEDSIFTPVQIEVRDAITGRSRTVTIIGVVSESISPLVLGITTAQSGQAAVFGDLANPYVHLFKLAPGVNQDRTAGQLEKAFLGNGMNVTVMQSDLDDVMGADKTFDYLLEGFMGLGLVVGVAALGVISARSVVERRQQIGVLRAIGFQKGMVELSFLMESSFVALLGIFVGTVLGLIIAHNVVQDQSSSGHLNVSFVVPWLNLILIFAAAYAVALLTTFLPARQASRIYPAEALRYE